MRVYLTPEEVRTIVRRYLREEIGTTFYHIGIMHEDADKYDYLICADSKKPEPEDAKESTQQD